MGDPVKILFLCTGNSARSIMGEYMLRSMAGDRFETYSAGAKPTGKINPTVKEYLETAWGLDLSAARSKAASEFDDAGLDIVITVCDSAREACPFWPHKTLVAHWGLPDPAAVADPTERMALVERVAATMKGRLERLMALPLHDLDPEKRAEALRAIGTVESESASTS